MELSWGNSVFKDNPFSTILEIPFDKILNLKYGWICLFGLGLFEARLYRYADISRIYLTGRIDYGA
ncbi:hypothetical protein A9Q97_06070 [Rhodospirillales bacterium 47_12_T64]|nr:hypothetical protein A9Q97_06070 [Rhodospirillales bacterium 47_12_T64]